MREIDHTQRTGVIVSVETYGSGDFIVGIAGVGITVIRGTYKVEPKVGDHATLHTYWFNSVRGIDLNGAPLFFKTDDDIRCALRTRKSSARCASRET